MKLLASIDLILEKIISWLLYLFVAILVLISFSQIILRNFFDSSITWGDVFLRHLVLWIAFLGAAIAAKIGRHIKIDITHRLLPKKFGKIILIFTLLFASYICYELMLASNDFVFTIIDPKEILFLQIPTQSFIIIIPIGYGIILFRFLLNAIFLSNEIKNNNWEVEEIIN